MNELPVVLISDDNYIITTAVAMQSVIDCCNKKNKLVFYVICCNVSGPNKKKLVKLADNGNVAIVIIDYDTSWMDAYNENGYYVTNTALVKFCVPRLVPKYDKILYIDGDVLVQKDITDIYDIDVQDYYCAAVGDIAAMADGQKFHIRLNIPRYFNSGVLLFNAEKFRKDKMEEKLFAIKNAHPEYRCMDQDVFNVGFRQQVKFIPCRWNFMLPNIIKDNYGVNKLNIFYNTDYASLQDAQKDACLIHITNEWKPWIYKNTYMSDEWLKTFSKTPFSETTLELKEISTANTQDVETKSGNFILCKIHRGNVTKLKLFGVPLAKRIRGEYEITTVVFGIFRFRKINGVNIKRKFNSYFARLNYTVDTTLSSENVHKIEWQNKVIRQIKLLDGKK